MNFIYSLIVGFLVIFAISAILTNNTILNDDTNTTIALLVGILTIIYGISRKLFEKVSLKEFLLSLFVIFIVLFITLLITVTINKETAKEAIVYLMPLSILVGLYSLVKNNYSKLKKKTKKCPCCKIEIPMNYFLKQILFSSNSISFTKNEKGIICQKCDKSILSAEKKNMLSTLPMFISMIPVALLGLGGGSNMLTLILVFSFSFIYFMLLVSGKYYSTHFICDDKSSNEYNSHSIHE